MTTSLFEPVERLTDDLTGAVPTWRLDEEPIYQQLRAGWADFYARLCGPVTDPAVDVVEGVVLEGPPTVAMTIVPTQPLDLPRECDDCSATGDEPCRTPSGKRRLSDHVSRIRSTTRAAANA